MDPRQIGPYRLEILLEADGPRRVYVASEGKEQYLLTFLNDEAASGSSRLFREFAHEQRNLSETVSGLLPVLKVGTLDGYSYYLQPYHRETFDSVLGRGFPRSSEELAHVLVGIVTVVCAIYRNQGRFHGDLSPKHIVLAGSGPPRKRRVLLANPRSQDAIKLNTKDKTGLAEDGCRLAELIESALRAAKLKQASAWEALAQQLRESSLTPAALEGLPKRFPGRSRGDFWLGTGVAACALLVGVGVYALTVVRQGDSDPVPIETQFVEYRQAYQNWIVPFAKNSLLRREELERDAYVRERLVEFVLENANSMEPSEAFGMARLPRNLSTVPPELETEGGLRERVETAYDRLEILQKRFADWPVRAQLREGREALAAAELHRLSEQLAPVAEEPPFDERLVEHTIATINAKNAFDAFSKAWSALKAERTILERLGDPTFAGLPRYHRTQLAAIDVFPTATERATALRIELKPVLEIVTAGDFERRFFHELYIEDLRQTGMAPPGPASFAQWVDGLYAYERVRHPVREIEADVALLREQLDRLVGELRNLEQTEAANRFQNRFDQWKAKVAEARRVPDIRRNRDDLQELAEQLPRVLNQIVEDARREYSANQIDPADWLAQTRQTTVAGPALLQQEWERRREAFLRTNQTALGDSRNLPRLGNALDELRTYVAQLPETLLLSPLVSELDDSPIEQVLADNVRQRRRGMTEAVVLAQRVLETPATRQELLSLPRIRSLQEQLDELAATAAALARAVSEAQSLLRNGQAWGASLAEVDQRLSSPAEAFREALEAHPQFQRLSQRLAGLRAIADAASVTVLFQRLETRSEARLSELRTAWERLRAFPPSALTARQLSAAADLASRLRATTADVGEREIVSQQGRELWANAAEQTPKQSEREQMFATIDAFDATPMALSPEVRLDFVVHQTLGRLSGDDALFGARGEPVAAALGQLEATLQQWKLKDTSPRAQALWGELRATVDPEAPVQAPDFRNLGPGAVGWNLREAGGGPTLTYRWSGFELVFRELELPGARRAYLAESELAVGLFLAWADEANRWQTFAQAAPRYLDGSMRLGPASWKPQGSLVNGAEIPFNWLDLPPLWRANYFASNDFDTPPEEFHPLQYVPARLALALAESLGCDLPAVEVYRAAFARNNDRPANLRDATWERQQSHLVDQARTAPQEPPWPDADIFLPRKDLPTGLQASAAVTTDDGALWFETVDRGSGPFLHLRGNVAEFARREDGAIAVIGASALSPAEIVYDQAYAIGESGDAVGFSDVGLRLSFMVPDDTPGTRFMRQLLAHRFYQVN